MGEFGKNTGDVGGSGNPGPPPTPSPSPSLASETFVFPDPGVNERLSTLLAQIREAVVSRFDSPEEAAHYLSLSQDTLTKQRQALPANHCMRPALINALIDIGSQKSSFKDTPGINAALLEQLYDTKPCVVTKFIIRELAFELGVVPTDDPLRAALEDACTFAKHMVTLRKNLSIAEGPPLLEDLARITKFPKAWAALLNHIVERVTRGHKVENLLRGSNRVLLVPILLNNEDARRAESNHARLNEIAGDHGLPEDVKLIARFLLGEIADWRVPEAYKQPSDFDTGLSP